MKEIKSKGDAQAEVYVDKVIEKGEIPVTNTISWNNFYTLQNRPPAVLDKLRKPGCKNPTAIVTRYFMCIKDRSELEKEVFSSISVFENILLLLRMDSCTQVQKLQ